MGLDRFRRLFRVLEERLWLNHAALAPLPLPAKQVFEKAIDSMHTGDYGFIDKAEEARRLFATLIGCSPDEVALMPNTSYGMAAVSTGLKYKPGANVVTTDLEFPSVVYTWLALQNRGLLKVRFVRSKNGVLRVEDFEKAIDDETVIVAVSHVEYQNGWRNDLKAICEIAHEHGAYVLDDAIQAVGAVKVDVEKEGIDFLAAGGYKWLLSPIGTGYLYVRRELIDELETPIVGASSAEPELVERFETQPIQGFYPSKVFRPAEAARRFEPGMLAAHAFVASAESLKILLEADPDKVEKRIAELIHMLRNRLEELGVEVLTPEMDKPAGILTFKARKPEEIVKRLRRMNIVVSVRGGGVRVSPHFYNNEEDIERLIDAVGKIIR